MEKNEVICLVSMSPSWVGVLKLSNKGHFLQFRADHSKKSKSGKAIYVYASESSRYTLLEDDFIYRDLSHRSWDISNWNIKKVADSAENLKNSWLSNPNVSETVSHSRINSTIFW